MRLTGKVITIESGDSYTDKLERVVIRFKEADSLYRDIRIPNADEYQLNDTIELHLEVIETPPSIEEYVAKIPFSLKDASKEVF